MPYYVNHTMTRITIHHGACHEGAENRHGPFKSDREAVLAARALAVIDIANCDHCGGAGDASAVVRCHCDNCMTPPP